MNRIRELNPLVSVDCVPSSPATITDEDLSTLACAVLCDLQPAVALDLADRCHHLGVPVYVAESYGFSGVFFVDLGPSYKTIIIRPKPRHREKEKQKEEENETEEVQLTLSYATMTDALRTGWSKLHPKTTAVEAYAWLALQDVLLTGSGGGGAGAGAGSSSSSSASAAPAALAEAVVARAGQLLSAGGHASSSVPALPSVVSTLVSSRGYDLAPVCAVMGGVLAGEVVKVISGKDEPIHNLFVFEGMSGRGGTIVSLG